MEKKEIEAMIQATKYSGINRLLDEMVFAFQNIFQDDLIGVYLYGSLVWGDFNFESSDIDVLVALKKDLSDDNFETIDKLHSTLIHHFPVWRDRLEIAYISQDVLQNFKKHAGKVAIMSPGEPFNIKEIGKDWHINFYLIQNTSVTLFGPKPNTIMEFISKDEFVFKVKQQALEWRDWLINTKDSVGYQYYAVLTLCRAYYVLGTGEQVSKLKAGQWMVQHFPDWVPLIDKAIAWHLTGQNQAVEPYATFEEVKTFVKRVLDLIEMIE